NRQMSMTGTYLQVVVYYFFFSSRRRHTRSDRDWSSDVCSSDLCVHELLCLRPARWPSARSARRHRSSWTQRARRSSAPLRCACRSEERRVGKECRRRRWPHHQQKEENTQNQERCLPVTYVQHFV